jgi:hypothetical protein
VGPGAEEAVLKVKFIDLEGAIIVQFTDSPVMAYARIAEFVRSMAVRVEGFTVHVEPA